MRKLSFENNLIKFVVITLFGFSKTVPRNVSMLRDMITQIACCV